jgi:4-hydroxy-tetrahydrodipicolinate synthase
MFSLRRCGCAVILVALLNQLSGPGRLNALMAAPPCARHSPWAGIYPTVVTPFCEQGVDIVSLERQLQYELHGRVHGLLVLGTIGEGAYTTFEERRQVITTAVRTAGPVIPVIVGIHTCNLDEARAQVLQARELGAAAVLVKYLGNPNASAGVVLGFYAVLSDMNCLPVLYYHYPTETGLALRPQDIANILALPGVVGIKESTLNLREVQTHMGLTRCQDKAFLSGTALNLTQFLELGGHGAMCPEAVLLPDQTVETYAAFMRGHRDEAMAIQSQLFLMSPILKDRPSPPAVTRAFLTAAENHKLPIPVANDRPQARLKAALDQMGIPTSPAVKHPLPPLTPREYERVKSAVARLKGIDWEDVVLRALPATGQTDAAVRGGGTLLQTGAFQLGPDVGRDLLRSQGDGKAGF